MDLKIIVYTVYVYYLEYICYLIINRIQFKFIRSILQIAIMHATYFKAICNQISIIFLETTIFIFKLLPVGR